MTDIVRVIDEITKAIKFLARRINSLEVRPKLTDTGVVVYQDTSTIIGWDTYSDYFINYQKICSFVCVNFLIIGNSDNAATSFTLPYTPVSDSPIQSGPIRATDSGVPVPDAIYYIVAGEAIVRFYTTAAGAGWTASGSKEIRGSFFYWAEI